MINLKGSWSLEYRISRTQFVSLMIYLQLATGILAMPATIGQFTVQDGWIVPGGFLVGTFVMGVIVIWFERTFPNQTWIQGLMTAFGVWGGRLAGGWVLIWFYVFTIGIFREVDDFIVGTILPNTPLYITSFLLTLPVALGVYWGIETIGRTAEFINILALISVPLVMAVSLRNADFSQLRPVLADGLTPVLRGSLVPMTFAFEFIIALQLVPYSAKPQSLGKLILYIGLFVTFFGLVNEVVTISVLGAGVHYLNFPILDVIRSIRIGANIERLDTIYVMGLVAAMTLKLSVLTFTGLSAVKEVFGFASLQHISWSGAAALWAGSTYLLPDNVYVRDFILFVAPVLFAMTCLGLPIAAIITRILRNSRVGSL